WWNLLAGVCPGEKFPFEMHEMRDENLFCVTYSPSDLNDDSCWAIDRLQLFDDANALIEGVRLLAIARTLERSETEWEAILPEFREVRNWPVRKRLPENAFSADGGQREIEKRLQNRFPDQRDELEVHPEVF